MPLPTLCLTNETTASKALIVPVIRTNAGKTQEKINDIIPNIKDATAFPSPPLDLL